MGSRQRTVAQRATTSEVVDLNRVDAFVRVVEAGSFTGAAHKLGLPKSSLSRAVSHLERELGVVLLHRTTRKLALTEAGQLYVERARSALALLDEARVQLVEADQEPRGLVRMTAPVDPAGELFASTLADFARRYPGIRVECMFTQRHVDLVAENVDLALRAGRIDTTLLAGKKLGDSPLGLFAAPSYLSARGTPRRLAQLAAHDCVLFRGVRGGARWTLEGKRGRETVEVHGALDVDEMLYALHLARCGAGIALLPIVLTRAAVDHGELVRVLPAYRQEGSAVYLVHPADRPLPRRVALLRDHLYDALRPKFAS